MATAARSQKKTPDQSGGKGGIRGKVAWPEPDATDCLGRTAVGLCGISIIIDPKPLSEFNRKPREAFQSRGSRGNEPVSVLISILVYL